MSVQSVKRIATSVLFLFISISTLSSFAQAAPFALIYKGPGSCSAEDGDAGQSGYSCSDASAVIAEAAGLQVKFVGPNDLPENATDEQVKAMFDGAKVWIQPGGVAVTALYSMSYRLREAIVKFVSDGGGYVGFCAGAFAATGQIGATRYAGLGIMPGYTTPYATYSETPAVEYSFQRLTWNGKPRAVYYEGGPYLWGYESDPSAEVVALYDTGFTAAARAVFGKGRVFVSGPHPEAPAIWSEEDQLHDPDGVDQDLAVEMVRWAGQL